MRTIRLSFPWHRVVALFFACLVCTALWAEAAQGQLADKVIRLHVLANSDSQADQALKLYVRDQILAQTTPLLEGVTSAPEAEAILQANLGPGCHRSSGVRLFRLGPSGGNLVPHPAIPGRGPPRRELPGPAGAHR